MTGITTSSTEGSIPLPKHALTLKYLRLRIIAILLQFPLTLLLTFSYYLRDPTFLKKYQVTRTRILVPSRQKGRAIKIDLYTPKGVSKKPYPVHINWHGSGFVLPCFGADTEMCSIIASKAGCVVVDADYRKAPQNPFPACIQDAEDVCLYILAHPKIYDVGKISVGGSSAGACIALSVGAKLGPEKIQAICSLAPPTDFRPSSRPKVARDPGHKFALPRWASLFFDSCYLVLNTNRSDPQLSPICAPPSSFPKSVYIATGTGDTLYNDGLGLIEKLKADNHPNAFFRSVEGQGHGFEKFRTDEKDNWATMVLGDIVNVIKGSWEQSKSTKASKM